MPWFSTRNPEDGPIQDPGDDPRADAPLRPQMLTQELLDWAIASLEAVLVTPPLALDENRRSRDAIRDGLKRLDHLYPATLPRVDHANLPEGVPR